MRGPVSLAEGLALGAQGALPPLPPSGRQALARRPARRLPRVDGAPSPCSLLPGHKSSRLGGSPGPCPPAALTSSFTSPRGDLHPPRDLRHRPGFRRAPGPGRTSRPRRPHTHTPEEPEAGLACTVNTTASAHSAEAARPLTSRPTPTHLPGSMEGARASPDTCSAHDPARCLGVCVWGGGSCQPAPSPPAQTPTSLGPTASRVPSPACPPEAGEGDRV